MNKQCGNITLCKSKGGKFMSEVKIKENETLDSALRRFKKTCAKAGIMGEVRKREHYDKPSIKRKKNQRWLAN